MAARTSARLAALFVALAIVIALVAWLALGVGNGTRVEVAAQPASPHDVAAPAAPLPQLADAGEKAAVTARATAPHERARPDESGPTAAELSDAWWIHGHVKYPDGTPPDERAFVVAQGREFGQKKLHRVAVAPDGTFRVAFHSKTKKGTLRLDARYVFLPELQTVKPEDADKELMLAADLGGALAGKLVPSAAAQPFVGDLPGATVTATGWKSGMNGPRMVNALVGDTLEFELGGLDPDINWSLTCAPKGFAPIQRERASLVRGERTPVELEILRGASVHGTVRDAAGAPVEGAQIVCEERVWDQIGMPKAIVTDAQGAFSAEGLRPGKIHMSAHKTMFLPARLDEIEVADGASRAGLVAVLDRGSSVQGVVRWPDGKPAAGVRVEVQEPQKEREARAYGISDDMPVTKTDGDGTFTITGLGAGPFNVTARSAPKAVEAAETKSKRAPKVRYQAEVEGVAANGPALVIVLAAGNTLRGHVVDDRGGRVDTFTIKAEPVTEPTEPWNARGNTISRDVSDKGGEFELFGLGDGEWKVHVETKAGSKSDEASIVFPREDAVLELVLARSATLRGVVLDAAGVPVKGAHIEVDVEGKEHEWSYRPPEKSRITGDDGVFESPVPAGLLNVHAERAGTAGSAIAKVPVAPAQAAGPVTLVLRVGGTITGVVRGKTGKLEAGRTVSAWNSEAYDSASATSDATGKFRMEHVTPGKVSVTLEPSQAEMDANRGPDGAYSWSMGQSHNSQLQVTIEDGATVDVALGGAPENPVRVFGVVRAAKPLAGVRVSLYRSDGEGSNNEWKQAVTDGDGRYEMTVDGPGQYQVSFSSDKGGSASTTAAIPAGSSYELNATLPSGSLSGRVLTDAGKPVGGVRVNAQSKHESTAKGELRTGYGSVETAADGTFTIEMLPAGEYSLTAQPERWGRSTARTKSNGRAFQDGIKLDDGASVTNIVLRMPRAGSVHGVVADAAGPVAGAQVLAHGDGPASGGESDTTDAAGRFQIDGLNPGTVVLVASTDTGASHPSAVEIRSDETAEMNLVLEPAGKIHVRIEDAQGKLTHTGWSVLDAQGKECRNYAIDWSDDKTGWTIGPLPAGAYTVRVDVPKPKEGDAAGQNDAGQKIERHVQLAGGATESVVVQLP
jgi:uncharacterized GH25 family protein